MVALRNQLDSFIVAVHRRLTIARIVEHIGLGIAIASALAIVAVPVRLARHESTMGIASILIAFGAVIGLAWGIARRPTRLVAAMEADRQLHLADLLGTAWAINNDPAPADQAWSQMVLLLAIRQCAAISPSAILVRRWGTRAWGGLGVSIALVLALGVLGPRGNNAPASLRSVDAMTANRLVLPPPQSELPMASRAAPRTFSQNARGDVADPNPLNIPSPVDETRLPSSQNRVPGKHGDADRGSGSGEAHGEHRSRPAPPMASPSVAATQMADSGVTDPSAVASPGITAMVSKGTIAGPWKTSSWPSARRVAEQAIRSGSIPDDYSEMVRMYFSEK